MCMNFYGLEGCHYFSDPCLLWDKVTGVKLELFDYPEFYDFIEKNI